MNETAQASSFEARHADYPQSLIRKILRETKVIAMVGASANWNRPSYFAMKYLQNKGYRVIPVNPREAGGEILGEKAYASLTEIPVAVDLVQCFRAGAAIPGIVEEAKQISPKVFVVIRRAFSRMRSKTTMVSLTENPSMTMSAATTSRVISTPQNELQKSVMARS